MGTFKLVKSGEWIMEKFITNYIGLSKVAGCRQKSASICLESVGYSAWHFFRDGIV